MTWPCTGARQQKGRNDWSETFLMVDMPGFPDCNTTMMIDARKRLWLFWPIILANTWDSCLTEYRISSDYQGEGAPKWEWQGIIPLAPPRFTEKMTATLDSLGAEKENANVRAKVFTNHVREMLKDKLTHRLGWQPRCKPTLLPSGRILLPLYTDTYSVSVMAISDDNGETWHASEPICGFGNIQPTVLRRNDGSLVAYMRENGILDKIRTSESRDDGETWGPVGVAELPNPGAGIDGIRLANGHWLLIYNDTTKGATAWPYRFRRTRGKPGRSPGT